MVLLYRNRIKNNRSDLAESGGPNSKILWFSAAPIHLNYSCVRFLPTPESTITTEPYLLTADAKYKETSNARNQNDVWNSTFYQDLRHGLRVPDAKVGLPAVLFRFENMHESKHFQMTGILQVLWHSTTNSQAMLSLSISRMRWANPSLNYSTA